MDGDAQARRSRHFKNPPLSEVVCGAQFAPIQGWLTAHYGLFWNRVRLEYPGSEDQAPLPRAKLEDFETPDEFNVSMLPPLRRVFLSTEPPNYLIQLQPNRFLHNWRKLNETDDYPRFPDAYSRFSARWADFRSFLADVELPSPRLDTYELTYVNMIFAPGVEFPRDVWRFMNFYKELPQTAAGADPKGLMLVIGWPLAGSAGRITMTLKHGITATGPQQDARPVMVAEFAARGRAEKNGADMDQWFRTAHDAIVHTFAALTTEEGHRMWGRVA